MSDETAGEGEDLKTETDGKKSGVEGWVMPLTFKVEVRGAHEIKFQEGAKTGDMRKPGVLIETVYWADNKRVYGGCIDRNEAKQLRDFLNGCIDLWENKKEA